ncbi:MAG: hypothetical protein QW186_06410 [Candidatus Bathyarchaeia archaeon]
MRKFRNNRKGQFIVLAAIIIAAFMFSLVLTISQMSLNRQELSYEPIDETILTITSDFERCLTKALAIATQENNETEGEAFIQEWFRATLESYKEFGIDITLTGRSQGRNVDWEIEWGKGSGKSKVYTTFGINIGAYGLEGLAITSIKAVYLNITEAKMIFTETENKTIIIFKVEQGGKRYNEVISDLTPENLELKINGVSIDRNDLNLSLTYVGEGTYIAQFNPNNLIVKDVTLMITTSDGIKVAASLESCLISFMSDDSTTQGYDNEGYFIINGTQRNPPYTISLFPNQVLNILFNPPNESTFERFSFSGPLALDTPESPSTIVRVLGEGSGEIVANYNSSSLYPYLTMCNLTLDSREYNESLSEDLKDHLGTFNVTNGTMYWSFNGSLGELPATLTVSYNQTLQISFFPNYGYVFKYWNVTSNTVWINSKNGTKPSIKVVVKGNGTIIAVYEKSRPEKWQYIYLSAKEKVEVKKENFVLILEPEKNPSEITPQLNNPHDKRSGNTTESTPMLYLGRTVNITLYAYYSKNKESIDVNVTLGFYNGGVLYRIGNQIITVTKPDNDNSAKYLVYEISFNTSNLGDPPIIPEGSWLTLILERLDPNDGGTLHIGEASKIKLWA